MEEWEKRKLVKSLNLAGIQSTYGFKEEKKQGIIEPKVAIKKGYGKKITDLEEFREFARAHGSQTQKEMAEAWEGEISDKTIGKALREIGFLGKEV